MSPTYIPQVTPNDSNSRSSLPNHCPKERSGFPADYLGKVEHQSPNGFNPVFVQVTGTAELDSFALFTQAPTIYTLMFVAQITLEIADERPNTSVYNPCRRAVDRRG